MGGQDSRQNVIAERLDHLIATVHEKGRGPYTLREIAEGVNEAAGERIMSVQYLSQLRRGERTEPSYSKLKAVADFFGVDVRYFSDDPTGGQTDEQLEVVAAMRDADVRNVALRAAGLSERSLKAVHALLDSVRELEGLDHDRPAAEDSGALSPI